MQDELCNAKNIEYKAYVRKYPGDVSIVYLVATCWFEGYGVDTDLYFEAGEATWQDWKLKQRQPDGMPHLNTFHIASGIMRSGLPNFSIPSAVEVEDAHGFHTVQVEDW